ncbi:hypothetical protein MMPV_009120 [Pyropia vietnamensis]
MDAPMATALGGEHLEAAADLEMGLAAVATPALAAESLATAAAVVSASAPAAGGGVGGAVVAAAATPPAGLFGPHFLLRAASHLVYVTFTVAILFQSPIAYAAGHSLLRVPVSWLATALTPHVGEVEEALAAARTHYAGARRFVKAVAVAALTALAGMDEDSDSDGGGGDSDGGGDDGGHEAAADAAGTGGDARATRPRPLRVPLEGAYYVEATPAWATAVAAEERRRAKDAAGRRPTGSPDADVWAAAGTEGPGRPLAESPAARMRRRGLRRATPSVGGRPGGPGLLAGALGDSEGVSSSSSVGVATDVATVTVRPGVGGSSSSGRGDRSMGVASSAGVAAVMGTPDRPRPRRIERATDKSSDVAMAASAAAHPRKWVGGASSSSAVATAMDSTQRPRIVLSSSDGVAAVLGTRGRAVSERRYGPDGERLTGRAAVERAKEMENLGAYRLVPPTVPGPGGPRRATSPRRVSVGAVEVSTRLAGVDDAYAELRALRASFRRPRLLGAAGDGGGGGGGSRASGESLSAAAVCTPASAASSPVASGLSTRPGAGAGRSRSGAPEDERRRPQSSVQS